MLLVCMVTPPCAHLLAFQAFSLVFEQPDQNLSSVYMTALQVSFYNRTMALRKMVPWASFKVSAKALEALS